MDLILERHMVDNLRSASMTGLDAGALMIDIEALASNLKDADERLARIEVNFASPGDATRIVCVKDVVQPRIKLAGDAIGVGTLRVLDNVGVVTCGPIVGFQEGIIDMSGPGADLSPFSDLYLVVLDIGVVDGLDPHVHEAALRDAGLRASDLIAASCDSKKPDAIEHYSWQKTEIPGLPRLAYIYLVLSQGLLHDTYVFGRNAREELPIAIDPRAAFDNAIISGNCVSACDKNTTFHHQNNPVIAELLHGHGVRWNFVGAVICNQPTRLADKAQSADAVIGLVEGMGADGAVVSKEGFGNPDADLMMLLRGLEGVGIKAVAITDEFAGTNGESQSLADTAPEADAIVSTGNANERVELPAMARTFGPLPDVTRLAGGYPHSLRNDGSMEVELQAIVGSTNQLGYNRLSCREV